MRQLDTRQSFIGSDILSVTQFTREAVENVLAVAQEMEYLVLNQGTTQLLQDKLMSVIFFEPSTRTSTSFQASMHRLGGKVVAINDVHTSSVAKGEILPDTLRTLESYSDVIVMRHYEKEAPFIGADAIEIPLINAGNGAGEHPTQALLDMYTIQKEKGVTSGLKVAFVGDLKYGRTVHSLSQILSLYDNELYFISPESLQMPEELVSKLQTQGTRCHFGSDLQEYLPQLDVIYMTRVQKERFTDLAAYEAVKLAFVLNKEVLQSAKESLKILHPLPRVGEISTDLDSDPRLAIFRQMRNGLYTRMALLALLFGRA